MSPNPAVESAAKERKEQVVGNYAYVAHGSAGLQVIDVSNPARGVRVGGYNGGFAGDVAVSGNYASLYHRLTPESRL
jgi:hypothetical protein